jgi:hypothetical protein
MQGGTKDDTGGIKAGTAAPVAGAADATAAGDLARLLTEVLKSVNKDSLGQFASTHAVAGASVEATRRTYEALDALAARLALRIAACLQDKGATTVLLQGGEDLSELTGYRALLAWMDEIEAGLGADEPAVALHGALGFIGADTLVLAGPISQAALALLGAATRSVVSQSHAPVAIGEAELLAALEPALRKQKLEPRRLSALLPRTAKELDDPARLLGRLRRMAKAADAARTRLGAIDAALPAPAPAPPPDAARLRGEKLRIEAALRVFDALWASVPAMLPRLLLADAAEAHMASIGAILTLRILAAGGTSTITSRFLGTKVEHSGAVLLRYALFDADGTPIDTGRLDENA